MVLTCNAIWIFCKTVSYKSNLNENIFTGIVSGDRSEPTFNVEGVRLFNYIDY